jgi:hypothetical protein
MAGILFDAHFDEEHHVLRNRLKITDAAELERHIARLSFVRVVELEAKPVAGSLDISHLRAIHCYIFQNVFPWAGDFREVTTSRTNSFAFPPPQFIVPSLEAIFTALHAEASLKHLGPDRLLPGPVTISARSTLYTRFAKATAVPSASLSALLDSKPGINSPGPTSRRMRTTARPASVMRPATAQSWAQ